jgi:hypothetical protein
MIAVPVRVEELQQDPSSVARRLSAVAVGLVALARVDVEERGLPTLYEAARRGLVEYRREPKGVEMWLCPSLVLAQGFGDCEDLSAWLTVDYRREGVKARMEIIPQEGSRLFHAVVRLPDNRIEDPSAVLIAMSTAKRGSNGRGRSENRVGGRGRGR